MTYMEFVGLSVIANEQRRNTMAAPFLYSELEDPQPGRRPSPTSNAMALISILFSLHAKGLVIGYPSDPPWGSVAAVNPRRLQVSQMGRTIIRLALLDTIPDADQQVFYQNLQRTELDTDIDSD